MNGTEQQHTSSCSYVDQRLGKLLSGHNGGREAYLSMRGQGTVQGQNPELPLSSPPQLGRRLQLAHQASDLRGARHEYEDSICVLACMAICRSIRPVLQHNSRLSSCMALCRSIRPALQHNSRLTSCMALCRSIRPALQQSSRLTSKSLSQYQLRRGLQQ